MIELFTPEWGSRSGAAHLLPAALLSTPPIVCTIGCKVPPCSLLSTTGYNIDNAPELAPIASIVWKRYIRVNRGLRRYDQDERLRLVIHLGERCKLDSCLPQPRL